MLGEQRTDIYPMAWKQCAVCAKPTYMHELRRRPNVVSVTRVYNMFGMPIAKHATTAIVDICPTCDVQEIEAERQLRGRRLLAIGGTAVAVFGWQYLGFVSLIPALVCVLVGSVRQRFRRQRALIRR